MDALREKLQAVLPDILRLSKQSVHANIIEMVEETIILKALEECGNNQVKAAGMLGISRNTLRHRLKRHIEKRNNIDYSAEQT
jgi:DNA-binding protein Fis